MAMDLESARRCVAFLFSREPSERSGEGEPVGTCFFGRVEGVTGGTGLTYLITARHVYDELAKKHSGYVRLNKTGGGVAFSGVSVARSDWLFHSDQAVDVAIQPLPWILDDMPDYELGYMPLDQVLNDEGTRFIRDWVREGEDAAFTGLMVNFVGKRKNLLALRGGMISLVTDELISGEYGPARYHVLDSLAYPGNSGAPVWVILAGGFHLMGVLACGISRTAWQEADRSTYRNAKVINLAVTLVTPIGEVGAILKNDPIHKRSKRQNKETAPVPLAAHRQPFTRKEMESALKKVSQKVRPSRPGRGSSET